MCQNSNTLSGMATLLWFGNLGVSSVIARRTLHTGRFVGNCNQHTPHTDWQLDEFVSNRKAYTAHVSSAIAEAYTAHWTGNWTSSSAIAKRTLHTGLATGRFVSNRKAYTALGLVTGRFVSNRRSVHCSRTGNWTCHTLN